MLLHRKRVTESQVYIDDFLKREMKSRWMSNGAHWQGLEGRQQHLRMCSEESAIHSIM